MLFVIVICKTLEFQRLERGALENADLHDIEKYRKKGAKRAHAKRPESPRALVRDPICKEVKSPPLEG